MDSWVNDPDVLKDEIAELEKALAEAQQARETDYKKAQEIAANVIGYPCDDDDVKSIENATPIQAMTYLDEELRKRLKELHEEQAERDTLRELLREAMAFLLHYRHWGIKAEVDKLYRAGKKEAPDGQV